MVVRSWGLGGHLLETHRESHLSLPLVHQDNSWVEAEGPRAILFSVTSQTDRVPGFHFWPSYLVHVRSSMDFVVTWKEATTPSLLLTQFGEISQALCIPKMESMRWCKKDSGTVILFLLCIVRVVWSCMLGFLLLVRVLILSICF